MTKFIGIFWELKSGPTKRESQLSGVPVIDSVLHSASSNKKELLLFTKTFFTFNFRFPTCTDE